MVRHGVPSDSPTFLRRKDDLEYRVDFQSERNHFVTIKPTRLFARWRAAGRVRRVLIAAGAFVVALALGVSALGAAWLGGYKVPIASGATYLRVQKLATAGDADRSGGPDAPFFVLLVGNDSRPGVGGSRGDALHLVGINPKLHKGTILDIPRDTCWNGDKINAANAQGGGAAQAQAVGGLIGVPVSYVVDVDFAGFLGLVDGVGGINMNIPTVMHDTYSGAYFQPGVQHLNSTSALAFSRDRHDFPQSDIIRTNNQGLLLLAAIAQLQTQAHTAGGQFHLISLLYQHAQLQNLGINDLFRLGRIMFRIPNGQIRNVTIPITGGNCLPLAGEAPGMFADFRDDAVLESH
jgi:LCP family protein required for cell wall assembly